MRLRDERPCHRLDHAARGERALGAPGARLDRAEDRLARRVAALEWRHRYPVDPDHAHDFLDNIGLAVHVGAPGRHRDLYHRAVAGQHETEMAEDALYLQQRYLDPGKPLDLGQRKIDDAVVAEGVADNDILRRRTAAQFDHQPGRHFKPRHHEGRIDAAFETIAGIGIDAELAAGLGDVDLVPQRRFDQHVGGLFRTAGGLAAHDAGKRFDAVIVRDHADIAIKRVGSPVEGQQRLGVARAPYGEVALDLGGIEHMQRARAVVGHEVGDIDQRVDRAQSDRCQAFLQPFWRWSIFDADHRSQRKARTLCRILYSHFQRSGKFVLDRL